MAYTLSVSLALGAGRAGLTDLRAQLVDTAGVSVGTAVSAGFVALGSGNYLWTGSIPDGHRGAATFYSAADGSTILAAASINPEEAENTDVKTSTRATSLSASGEFDVEFTVRDSETLAAIRRARVTIRASDGTTRVDQRDTSNAGLAAFNLDAGTYYRQVSAPGYAAATLDDFTVSADTEITIDLDPLPVSEPASGDLCTVYDFLYVDGTPDEGATITASIAQEDLPTYTDDVLISGETRTATADTNGRWELQLVRGKVYRITALAYGLNETAVEIPDEDSATLRSLLT